MQTKIEHSTSFCKEEMKRDLTQIIVGDIMMLQINANYKNYLFEIYVIVTWYTRTHE